MSEAARDFALLTFHGTLLNYDRRARALCHRALDDDDAAFLPLRLVRDAEGGLSAVLPPPPASDAADRAGLPAALAGVAFEPGLYPGTIAPRRQGFYASAARDGRVAFTANQCMGWESFARLTAAELALLRHIPRSFWTLPGGATVAPEAIKLDAGFTLNFGDLRIDLTRDLPRAAAENPNRITLTPRQGEAVVAERVRWSRGAGARAEAGAGAGAKIWILPLGNTGNRALQYLTAEAMRVEFPEATVENVLLPEWDRVSPQVRPPADRSAATGHDRYRIDVPGLADCLRRGVVEAVVLESFTYNLDQFPARAVARKLLGETVTGREARGFGPRELVCSVRAGEVLTGLHPDYLVLPPAYYRMLAEQTGLDLVFYGQLGQDDYSRSLREAFPQARFVAGRDPGFDFDTLRRSAHVALAISTFSWLAGWLGEAETVYLPVGGMFNPVQHPDQMYLPFDDPAYRFVLLPYAKAVSLEANPAGFARQQALLGEQARLVTPAEVRALWLRAEPLGQGRVLVGGFDADFYAARYPDASEPALEHYLRHGAAEGRLPLDFDPDFYVGRYPDAAMEIAAGLHATPLRHFMAVGWRRGYLPRAE